MAKQILGVNPTSVVIRLKLMDSTSTAGAGKTGLAYNSTGLIISTIREGFAVPAVYTTAAGTIETITTLGTYAAPTATKCRFKEVDATNHPGIYELQLADGRFDSTTGLLISISGVTGLAQADFEYECRNLAANVIQVNGTSQTARDLGASVLLSSGTGTGQLDFTSGIVKSNLTQILGTLLTETSSGLISAAFKKLFDIAAPASTLNDLSTLAKLLKYVQLMTRKDTAIQTDNATEYAAINASGGSGVGTYDNKSDSIEAIRDRGDLAWVTGSSSVGNTQSLPTAVAKIVGGTLTGDHTNLVYVDASYCSLAETTTGTFLEMTAAFTAPAGNSAARLNVWGYYDGGSSHFIRVMALDQIGGTTYEQIGTIPIATSVQSYSFTLSPNHVKSDGACTIKFLHNASPSGVGSHVLYLDKVALITQTPAAATVDANLVAINGELTNGYNATLKLSSLDIQNAEGNAVTLIGTGGFGLYAGGLSGICAVGDDAVGRAGIEATGYQGVRVIGTDQAGLYIEGQNQGILAYGHDTDGGGYGAIFAPYPGAFVGGGIVCQALGAGRAMELDGGTSGIGLYVYGIVGAQVFGHVADGIQIASAGDGSAVNLTGHGAGAGLLAVGGTNGEGIYAKGKGAKAGMHCVADGQANGAEFIGNGRGYGIYAIGGGEEGYGHGAYFLGGRVDAHGLLLQSGGASGNDLHLATPSTNLPITGTIDANVVSIDDSIPAAELLAISSNTMISDLVDDTNFLPTTTEFEVVTINDADLSHYRDRWVIVVTGPLARQARLIKNYSLVSGKGHLVCDAFTDVLASGDRIIIV